jgi:hypothetical protein
VRHHRSVQVSHQHSAQQEMQAARNCTRAAPCCCVLSDFWEAQPRTSSLGSLACAMQYQGLLALDEVLHVDHEDKSDTSYVSDAVSLVHRPCWNTLHQEAVRSTWSSCPQHCQQLQRTCRFQPLRTWKP